MQALSRRLPLFGLLALGATLVAAAFALARRLEEEAAAGRFGRAAARLAAVVKGEIEAVEAN